MIKTFADMTPTERATCMGMKCDLLVPGKQDRVITYHGECYDTDGFHKIDHEGAVLITKQLQYITPRFDLPQTYISPV